MSLLDSWKSPKYVLAPMVDGSELAWRMLGRKYGVQLTFTPMINSTSFLVNKKYRHSCLQFASEDRPIIVQFCANSPDTFIKCAKLVQPFCDAVDLNLGCPQGIAKKGHYGAFLQDEWDCLKHIVSRASSELSVPVTCKIRIFSDVDRTVQYAKFLEAAGASMLTVHGRTREMKGQKTGLADWNQIRAVKEAVKIPVIANGNIQYLSDVHRCLDSTKADAVMSAEGHLHNPALFSGIQPCVYDMCFEYLNFVEKYPTSLPIIRGHIFKLCHYSLDEHPEYRSLLGSSQSTEGIKEMLQKMANHCSSCTVNSSNVLPHPHWLCQPYERPTTFPVQENFEISAQTVSAESNFQATDKNERTKNMLTEQRRSRKASKKEAKLARKLAIIDGQLICTSCNKNRKSVNCVRLVCRPVPAVKIKLDQI
ncbi:hypothetical protein MN116_004384 [Schistosoma mekongi]|uniref:tRNA-dihydrouridine(16/17) synthase [NAD(P)(+)] n=1 Tax=Schistosoma mekongi TaxID=38744 RepID=A0AAE1ZFW4_SCHME|nr:hypothetical protein MN116_004384 [Schistosoma mekongi]